MHSVLLFISYCVSQEHIVAHLGNQMTCLFDQTQHLVNIRRPGIQDIGSIALWLESDDTA